MQQNTIILNTLRDSGDWIEGFKLQQVQTAFGWIGSRGSRDCRQLAHDGYIDRKIEGRYAYYKINQKGLDKLNTQDKTTKWESSMLF